MRINNTNENKQYKCGEEIHGEEISVKKSDKKNFENVKKIKKLNTFESIFSTDCQSTECLKEFWKNRINLFTVKHLN